MKEGIRHLLEKAKRTIQAADVPFAVSPEGGDGSGPEREPGGLPLRRSLRPRPVVRYLGC